MKKLVREIWSFLILLVVTGIGGSAWAGSDYYMKAANHSGSTGSGYVYVGTDAAEPTDTQWKSVSEGDDANKKYLEGDDKYAYYFSKADETSQFDGWFTSRSGTSRVDTEGVNPYKCAATTTDSSETLYAKFTKLPAITIDGSVSSSAHLEVSSVRDTTKGTDLTARDGKYYIKKSGDQASVTFVAQSGYAIVSGNPMSLGAITADRTITAQTTGLPVVSTTVTIGSFAGKLMSLTAVTNLTTKQAVDFSGGSFSAVLNQEVGFYFTPDTHYVFQDGNEYKLKVTEPVTVSSSTSGLPTVRGEPLYVIEGESLASKHLTVSGVTMGGASVTPSGGRYTVEYGQKVTVTVGPTEGYILSSGEASYTRDLGTITSSVIIDATTEWLPKTEPRPAYLTVDKTSLAQSLLKVTAVKNGRLVSEDRYTACYAVTVGEVASVSFAATETGYRIVGNNPMQITMDRDKTLDANWKESPLPEVVEGPSLKKTVEYTYGGETVLVGYENATVVTNGDDLVFVFSDVKDLGQLELPRKKLFRANVLAVAGGGSGGTQAEKGLGGGGGGAGGYAYLTNVVLSAGLYGMHIGRGGRAADTNQVATIGAPGDDSFVTNAVGTAIVSAYRGGYGGASDPKYGSAGGKGGSGGGGAWQGVIPTPGGAGMGGSGRDGQGHEGAAPASSWINGGGGGGGAGSAGGTGGQAGEGVLNDITGKDLLYCRGGTGGTPYRTVSKVPDASEVAAAEGQGPGYGWGGDGGMGGIGGAGADGVIIVRLYKFYENTRLELPTVANGGLNCDARSPKKETSEFLWVEGNTYTSLNAKAHIWIRNRNGVGYTESPTLTYSDVLLGEPAGVVSTNCVVTWERRGELDVAVTNAFHYKFTLRLKDEYAWDTEAEDGASTAVIDWRITDDFSKKDATVDVTKTVDWIDGSNAVIRIVSHTTPQTYEMTPKVLFFGTLCGAHSLTKETVIKSINAIAEVGDVDWFLFNKASSETGNTPEKTGQLSKGDVMSDADKNFTFADNSNHSALNAFYEYFDKAISNTLISGQVTSNKYDYIVMEFDGSRMALEYNSEPRTERNRRVAEWLLPYYEATNVIWIIDNGADYWRDNNQGYFQLVSTISGATQSGIFEYGEDPHGDGGLTAAKYRPNSTNARVWSGQNAFLNTHVYYNDDDEHPENYNATGDSGECSNNRPWLGLIGLLDPLLALDTWNDSTVPYVEKRQATVKYNRRNSNLTDWTIYAGHEYGNQIYYDNADSVVSYLTNAIHTVAYQLRFADNVVDASYGLTLTGVNFAIATGDPESSEGGGWETLVDWDVAGQTNIYSKTVVPGVGKLEFMTVSNGSNKIEVRMTDMLQETWARLLISVADNGMFRTSRDATYNTATGKWEKSPNEGNARVELYDSSGQPLGVEGEAAAATMWEYYVYDIVGVATNGTIMLNSLLSDGSLPPGGVPANVYYNKIQFGDMTPVTAFYYGRPGHELKSLQVDNLATLREFDSTTRMLYAFGQISGKHTITADFQPYMKVVTSEPVTNKYDGLAHVCKVNVAFVDDTERRPYQVRYAWKPDALEDEWLTESAFLTNAAARAAVKNVGDAYTIYYRVYAWQIGYGTGGESGLEGWGLVGSELVGSGSNTLTVIPRTLHVDMSSPHYEAPELVGEWKKDVTVDFGRGGTEFVDLTAYGLGKEGLGNEVTGEDGLKDSFRCPTYMGEAGVFPIVFDGTAVKAEHGNYRIVYNEPSLSVKLNQFRVNGIPQPINPIDPDDPDKDTGVKSVEKMYDGFGTNILVNVTFPTSDFKVEYSRTGTEPWVEGKGVKGELPPFDFTNVCTSAAGRYTVYYRLTAENCLPVTNHAYVTIGLRPVKLVSASATDYYHNRATLKANDVRVAVEDGFCDLAECDKPLRFECLGILSRVETVPNDFRYGLGCRDWEGDLVTNNYSFTCVRGSLTLKPGFMIVGYDKAHEVEQQSSLGNPRVGVESESGVADVECEYSGFGTNIFVRVVRPVGECEIRYTTKNLGTPEFDDPANWTTDIALTNCTMSGNAPVAVPVWYSITDTNGNYLAVTNYATVRIVPKAASVTAGSNSWTYDGEEHMESSFSCEGFVLKEGLARATITGAITHVGTVTNEIVRNADGSLAVEAKEGTLLSNYVLTNYPGMLAVTPRALTLVSTNKSSKVREGSSDVLQLELPKDIIADGYVGDERFDYYSDAWLPVNTTGRKAASFWYDAKSGNASLDDYSVTTNYGWLTVGKGNVIVGDKELTKGSYDNPGEGGVTNVVYVYDGFGHSVDLNVTYPDVSLLTISYSLDGAAWTDTLPMVTNVCEEGRTVSIRFESEDYVDSTVCATVKVLPRPVTVMASGTNTVYGVNPPPIDRPAPAEWFVVSNAVDETVGDTFAVPLRYKNGDGFEYVVEHSPYLGEIVTNAVIAVSNGHRDVTGNYLISFEAGDLAVDPAKMTVSVPDVELDYYFNGGTGQKASTNVTASVESGPSPERREIWYRVDGVGDWTSEPPVFTDVKIVDGRVASYVVETKVRDKDGNYEETTVTSKVTVNPRKIQVKPEQDLIIIYYDGQKTVEDAYPSSYDLLYLIVRDDGELPENVVPSEVDEINRAAGGDGIKYGPSGEYREGADNDLTVLNKPPKCLYNYEIEYLSGMIHISGKCEILYRVNGAEQIYSGQDVGIEVVVTNVPSDKIEVLYANTPDGPWNENSPTHRDVSKDGGWPIYFSLRVKGAEGQYQTSTNNCNVRILPRPVMLKAADAERPFIAGVELRTNGYEVVKGLPGYYDFVLNAEDEQEGLESLGMTGESWIIDVGETPNVIDPSTLAPNDNTKLTNYTFAFSNGVLRVTEKVIRQVRIGGEGPFGPEIPPECSPTDPRDTTDAVHSGVKNVVKTYDGVGTNVTVVATDADDVGTLLDVFFLDESGEWVAALDFVNAGTNKVWYKVETEGYYVVSNYAYVVIDPREVTLTSGGYDGVYDAKTHSNATVSVEGFVGGEGVLTNTWVTITDVGTNANAFTYSFADGTVAENYRVTCRTNDLVVTRFKFPGDSQELYLDATNFTYNAFAQGPIVTNEFITVDGVNFPTNLFDLVGNVRTNANGYVLEFRPKNPANFEGALTVPWRIAKAPLTVTPDPMTLKFRDPKPQQSEYPGWTAATLLGEDTKSALTGTAEYSTTYAEGAGIGSYGIGVKGLESENYDLTFADGVLTVVPAPMPPPDKTEGPGPAFDPENPGPQNPPTPVDPSGLRVVLSDFDTVEAYAGKGWTIDTNSLWAAAQVKTENAVTNVEFSLDGTVWQAEPFYYTNVVATSFWYRVGATNYSNYYHSAGVTVTQRVVQVTSGTQEWTYDGLDHMNTSVWVSAGSFAPGEGISTNGFASVCSVGTNDNAFTVLWTGADPANYSFSAVTGKISVVAKTPEDGGLALNAVTETLYYNRDAKEPKPGVTDTINGTTVMLEEGADYDYSWLDNTNATETAKLVATFKGNYSGALTNDFTILPRTVTLTSGTDSWTYDGRPHTNETVTATAYTGDAKPDAGLGFVSGEGVRTNSFATVETVTNGVPNAFVWAWLDGTLATNYTVGVTTGRLSVVAAALPPPDWKPGDPEEPPDPKAGPYDGPDLKPGEGPLPVPTNRTDGTWLKLSNFDVVTNYDGEAHAFDTNSLFAKLAAADYLGNPWTVEYSLTGDKWESELFAFTDVLETPTSFWYRVSVPNFTNYIHAVGVVITQRVTTITFEAEDKVYDGSTAATHASTWFANKVEGEDFTLDTSSMSFTFDTADIGEGKTVTADGYSDDLVTALEGTLKSNYTFNFINTTTANITSKEASFDVTVDPEEFVWEEGLRQFPTNVVVMDNGTVLQPGVDYTYVTNAVSDVKKATVTVTGIGNYAGSSGKTNFWITAHKVETWLEDVCLGTNQVGKAVSGKEVIADCEPPEGYSLDAWTSTTNGIVRRVDDPQGLLLLTVRYEKDSNDDGMPDKYQRKITFRVINGRWDDSSLGREVQYAWVTKYNEDGEPDVNGSNTVGGVVLSAVDVPAAGLRPIDKGFAPDGAWWPGEPKADMLVDNDTPPLYVFGYSRAANGGVQRPGYGSSEPEKPKFTAVAKIKTFNYADGKAVFKVDTEVSESDRLVVAMPTEFTTVKIEACDDLVSQDWRLIAERRTDADGYVAVDGAKGCFFRITVE